MSHMHHHCDGYPEGVGGELSDFLSDYNGEWEPDALSDYFNGRDCDYEQVENDVVWDQEYVYVIGGEKKTLQCYYKGISDDWNYDEPGQEEMIPGNCFATCNCMTADKSQQKREERRQRRERIAIAAMQGIYANQRLVQLIIEDVNRKDPDSNTGSALRGRMAEIAVAQADKLMEELDKD